MTFGSLFAGIGGMDLGLERAGMTCKWQVEIDPFCQKVLTKHWPEVPKYGDITKLTGSELEPVDWICGGFPCIDVSSAGTKVGADGPNSGLWRDAIRIVRALRPSGVLLENVSALLVRGIGRVLGELAASGYDAEWDCLPAAAFGAPQPRWRVFIIADNDRIRFGERPECYSPRPKYFRRMHPSGLALAEHRASQAASIVRGMDHDVPSRVDRNRALGNAVVPQVAEWIGRRIMEAACAS